MAAMLNIPSITRKPPKPSYKKPDAIKQLEQLSYEADRIKYPNMPDYALARRTFRDDTANALTKSITTYISLKGGFGSRVYNGGIYDSRLKKYRPGTSRRGLPDILGTYNGLSLFIEVKIGRDRIREYQKKVEKDQVRAGGHYYIARNFTGFKLWFDSL